MKKYGIIRVALVAAGCSLIGVVAGAQIEVHNRTPREISNNCAHYDMESGEFTWGAKPIVVLQTDASDLRDLPGIDPAQPMESAVKPRKKPPAVFVHPQHNPSAPLTTQ